jgi:HlyD family secretion protein
MSLRNPLSESVRRPIAAKSSALRDPHLNSEPDESLAIMPARKPAWPWCALAAGVLAAGIAVLNVGASGSGDAVNIRNGGTLKVPRAAPFERYIAAPARVESVAGRRELAFHSAGRIRTFFVEENQAVKAGELLGELENDDLQARVAMAKADLQQAQAGYGILEADLEAELTRAAREVDRLAAERELLKPREEEVARARAEVRAAEAEWKRRQDDAARNADERISSQRDRDMARGQAEISAAQLDATRTRVKEMEAGPRREATARADAMLDAARAEVKRIQASRAARLEAAGARIGLARASLQLAEAELSRTRLLSPLDGRVVRKHGQAGETVSVMPPIPVIVVADDRQVRVRASIDESDFLKVKPGQRARIGAAAFDGKYLEGVVESISAEAGEKRFSTGEARERQDVKVVETLIRLTGSPQLKLGLRVTAYLEQPPR